MTAAEHLARAEQLIATFDAGQDIGASDWMRNHVAAAIGHALIALAIETGVPHSAAVGPAITPPWGEPAQPAEHDQAAAESGGQP